MSVCVVPKRGGLTCNTYSRCRAGATALSSMFDDCNTLLITKTPESGVTKCLANLITAPELWKKGNSDSF